ncbi:6-phosphogluconolactonase [Flavihumibacter petaseus]|uniref:6-phosphogluconolactonase n=1 Tax=Flavihumibacter petaseus NBRC 106054 TaxID=1220578 RepID=A0A0E9MXL3_9BACT|nr:6-phosphogluconolactonase [Flavihumibacter petaseus]GAO42166.1 6-phosphogluconolactonase [Flavihumibacter petaseus NBRC 106054]
MTPSLHIYPQPEAVAQAAASFIAERINTVLQKQERFTIALSGGSTPKRLHELLADAPYRDQIDWSRLHIFWGDERYVPLEDERNNGRMAYDTLLNHVAIPEDQIHLMRTDLPDPNAAARAYEQLLHRYFDGQPHSFDLLILGMGDDAHTLSLFPGTEVIHEMKRWCAAFFLDKQDMFRVTITRPVANASACILFLTTGKAKAPALKEVLQGARNIEKYPSQSIQPVNGELHWIIDQAAASELSS